MTTEEKAKAYDEALKDMRVIYPSLKGDAKLAVEHAFPQLKESEDKKNERIQKFIAETIFCQYGDSQEYLDVLAYLEKQKEQKPISFNVPFNPDDYEVVMQGDATGIRRKQQKEQKPADLTEMMVHKEPYIAPVPTPMVADEQKPIKWTDLTWKDIVELEGIINNVHYDFSAGIGQESFGKEVLERFRSTKGIEYLDEAEQKCWREEGQKEQKLNPDKEKLIKHCIGLILTDATDKRFKDYSLTLKDCLTWLGRQTEQKPAEFTHHEINESLKDAVTHQMEDDGDIDDFVRKGIDDVALKYAELGAKWQKEHKRYWKPTETDIALFNKAVTTNKALTPAERAQLDIIRSKFGCCRAVNCSGIVQKEQKPAEWNANDKAFIKDCARILDENGYTASAERLLSMFPVMPAEWSEEDEIHRNFILESLEDQIRFCKKDAEGAHYAKQIRTAQNWLKALRPQPKRDCKDCAMFLNGKCTKPHWKPSEEEIGALNYAYCELFKRGDVGHNILGPLQKLCDELKEL